jgi:hypothetical protein
MTAPKWVTKTGFLGTVTERQATKVAFTVSGTASEFSVITGNLPGGLVLQRTVEATTGSTTGYIIGSPTSVPTKLSYQFVIRAKNDTGISDRTFLLDAVGSQDPIWVTPSGYLHVGTSGECFAVNENYVDYQLSAIPHSLFENMKLRYYIAENDGQLPNGLRLTEDGRITGIIDEITVLEDIDTASDAGYDTEKYDKYPYDSAVIIDEEVTRPKFIKKIYQFYITATDGFNSSRKLFKIQVVDANTLRSDTTYIQANETCFLSGNSYLFAPRLVGPANLGIRRAGNYQIITVNTYDPFPELGTNQWTWDDISVNPEIRVVADTQLILPIDPQDPQLTDYYPKYNRTGDSIIYLKNLSSLPSVGQQFRLDSYMAAVYTTTYIISSVTGTVASCQIGIKHSPVRVGDDVVYNTTLLEDIPDDTIFYIGTPSNRPIGFKLDPLTGNLYGQIPYIPAYSLDYKFTIRVTKTDETKNHTNKVDRVFQLRLQGSIDTDMEWITTSTVGVIGQGYQSELSVQAQQINYPELGIQYRLVGGQLPNGLEFKSDGSIAGRIPYGGTTEIDYYQPTRFTIDGGDTTIDRTFTFTAEATNAYRLATIDRTFKIVIGENSPVPFSRVYVRPFMYRPLRKGYRNFISDPEIIDRNDLYRPSDPAFGIQQEIRMVIEYGLEKLNLAEYVIGLQNYFYNKRFFFGAVKTLPAEDERGNHVYDLVYVDIIDNMLSTTGRSPDNVSFLINQGLVDLYANSVDNWQKSLESINIYGKRIMVDEYLRPRFMRTIQESTGAPLGFIKAVPICYVKPGMGAKTIRKIQLSGYDFKILDFEVDRLIIDQTFDYSGDKYLKFPIKNIDDIRPLNVLAGPDGVIITDEDGSELLVE